MKSEWRHTLYGVSWNDSGQIELEAEDGTIVRAELDLDVAFNGEDEYPVPMLIPDTLGSFYNFKRWRFV